jgi:hypothetical protein
MFCQKYLNCSLQHSYVEYAIKFVGFGEEEDNKIIESRGPEVRGGRGNCVIGNV